MHLTGKPSFHVPVTVIVSFGIWFSIDLFVFIQYSYRFVLYNANSARLYSQLCCRDFMFYICYMYLFMYASVQHDFQITSCSLCIIVTWRVPLVEQELLYFRNTWVHFLRFFSGSCCSITSFLYSVLLMIVCPFVFFSYVTLEKLQVRQQCIGHSI